MTYDIVHSGDTCFFICAQSFAAERTAFMSDDTDTLDTKPLSPGAAQVRSLMMTGRVSVQDFATGIDKSVRTAFAYIAEGMPTDYYVGNTPYPKLPEALDCAPLSHRNWRTSRSAFRWCASMSFAPFHLGSRRRCQDCCSEPTTAQRRARRPRCAVGVASCRELTARACSAPAASACPGHRHVAPRPRASGRPRGCGDTGGMP